MKNTIGILDFGFAGNLHSISKALKKANAQTIIVSSPEELERVDRLILPGVGAFATTMKVLEKKGIHQKLQSFDRPILGICLGMQLFANKGYEQGVSAGLGLIDAEVGLLQSDGVLPNVGFKKLNIVQDCELMRGVEEESFYFMHSYEMSGGSFVTAFSKTNDYKFVASVKEKNIYGVQFHPEKSRLAGIKVLENFVNI